MSDDCTVEALGGTTVQRRGRKVYFVDGAVRSTVQQRGMGLLRGDRDAALLQENALASHLQNLSRHDGARLFHWRKGKFGVAFVYDHSDTPLAFDVTDSAQHDTASLRAFQDAFPRFAGNCWFVSPSAVPSAPADSADGIGRIGLAPLLRIVGSQTRQAFRERLTG